MTLDEGSIDRYLAAALRLALALALALPLGWERERRSRSAGLRTYPLVSACVCGFLLIGQQSARSIGGQADVFYGVLNGIGFVASGAVLKFPEGARAMSTAVSVWVTGAIGAGVACDMTLISAALSLLSTLTLATPSLIEMVRRRSAP